MKIATFNVNSIKARLPRVLEWLREAAPDVALLQEIKTVDEAFPAVEIEDLGYNIATHGQKTYNGVAILSKHPIEDVTRGLPGDDGDEQARYIEATIGDLRVAAIYLPNGNPVDSEKYPYKLAWMARLEAHAKDLLAHEESLILAGDYNVIAQPKDARHAKDWINDALYQPESRAAFRALINLGFTDALRACQPGPGVYTFWDYQAGAWQKNNGIRIDHLLLSPQAADRLGACAVDKHVRAWEKPSDHVPVWIDLDL